MSAVGYVASPSYQIMQIRWMLTAKSNTEYISTLELVQVASAPWWCEDCCSFGSAVFQVRH